MPTRDPDTGFITTAGYIPLIQKFTKYTVMTGMTLHLAQSAIRIIMDHDTIFPVWLPTDTSRSPVYEIIIIMQVCSHCKVN
jgi:hypothetical protein